MESQFLKIVFKPPPSIFLNILSVINLLLFANGGISELRGKNMPYSKFLNSGTISSEKQGSSAKLLSGRIGMLIIYAPAFLASFTSFFVVSHENTRILCLKSVLVLHFFKRVIEVLFVHKYSGAMAVDTSIAISTSYLSTILSITYAQHLSQGLEEPPIDLKYFGLLTSLIGMIGNFYHHYLLSKQREKNRKIYMIPKGGLFDLVICPHYLFEIIVFLGLCFISQTFHSFSIAIGTMLYLIGRSCATRDWYISKFEDFPKDKKVLIPYVF